MLIEIDQVMVQLKEGMEGNALKVTVMDRLVAELAGIETALVSLQDQVIFVFSTVRCSIPPVLFFSTICITVLIFIV